MTIFGSRRDFLKHTGGTLAMAALALPAFPAADDSAPAKKRKLRKGVSLDMVRGNQSIMDKFELLKDLGFDGIELNYPNGPDKSKSFGRVTPRALPSATSSNPSLGTSRFPIPVRKSGPKDWPPSNRRCTTRRT